MITTRRSAAILIALVTTLSAFFLYGFLSEANAEVVEDDVSRFYRLTTKYQSTTLGSGNQSVKEIPKAKLYQLLWDEWEMCILSEEETVFLMDIKSKENVMSFSDGRLVIEVFPELEGASREDWLDFLRKFKFDDFGYAHVETDDGEDLLLLAWISTGFKMFSETDFRETDICSLPLGDSSYTISPFIDNES